MWLQPSLITDNWNEGEHLSQAEQIKKYLVWEFIFETLKHGGWCPWIWEMIWFWVDIFCEGLERKKTGFQEEKMVPQHRGDSPPERYTSHPCYEGSQFLLPRPFKFSDISLLLSDKITSLLKSNLNCWVVIKKLQIPDGHTSQLLWDWDRMVICRSHPPCQEH